MSKLSMATIAVALTQLGVHEKTGNNDGPEVEKYLKAVGLNKGNPWCMAFVVWCVNTAGTQLGVRNPLLKTGGVLKQWNGTLCKRTKTPAPGSIFIMDFGKGTGHTGFVERVEGNIIHTIEGNTNDDGSREGIKVCRRTRKAGTILGYIEV
ncbi:CHAP domain-containing protein [Mucilaginibacter sp. Bleaf8]|uniref:CHAP domain-containing protein n=1 Tax=Mucilaginibacter sp. Bleaf8 TaxID=2834430 RepID=UPI001BCAC6EB|nr:CHAP domain-containing protein [Mucilaginibacter sp. Bleaf8]MBS7565080.1 CHAP domain-containing protein [Mucilaginibacter sp. Bleaf8]